MAIIIDSTSSGTGSGSASFTHTITTSGSDRALYIGASGYVGADGSGSIDSATYDGNAMTKLDGFLYGNRYIAAFRILAPSTGANTVAIAATSMGEISSAGISYTGVDQSTPEGTLANNSGTTDTDSTNIDITTSVTAEQNWVVLSIGGTHHTDNAHNLIADSGESKRVQQISGSTYDYIAIADEAGAATVALRRGVDNALSGRNIAIIGIPIRPSVSDRKRLVKYIYNTLVSRRVGRPIILDALGRDIPLEQIEVDNWMYSYGGLFPTTNKYSSLVEDPSARYIEAIKARGAKATIETARETMIEGLMRRLGGRGL